ncbi:MAG: ABC transporter ATP-binding protein, partial [Oligoflexales bacterium]|nr:ABC transporter ATP-binding protein [Oligoflexales bacterium]
MSAALELKDLTIEFGGLKAVSAVSFSVPAKSIFGLIGPNGAGKTSVFNMITGLYKPSSGSVRTFGRQIDGMKVFHITRMGVARTFQNLRLFKELSVLDNLLVAMDHNPKYQKISFLSSLLQSKSFLDNEQQKREKCTEILSFFKLDQRSLELAKNLPYGDQKRLEIARALATDAKLILLDEPAAGLNPHESHSLMENIRFIRDRFHTAVLLIEHDMK